MGLPEAINESGALGEGHEPMSSLRSPEEQASGLLLNALLTLSSALAPERWARWAHGAVIIQVFTGSNVKLPSTSVFDQSSRICLFHETRNEVFSILIT